MNAETSFHASQGIEPQTDWHKHKRLVRDGFEDLACLPRSRAGWDATLAALAYSIRRQLDGTGDLKQWAAMHGCQASARYRELGKSALVLWHGTTGARAERIARYGLAHKRGVWAALEPRIAHGYSRSRGREYATGSAMVVLLLESREVRPDIHYDLEAPEVLRFHSALPAECVEYIMWDDRIEFLGEQGLSRPKRWGSARFKKKSGRWVPLSRPPVRFDDVHHYDDLEGWLHLSVERALFELGSAAAIEVFSTLYATIDPWDALEHEAIFRALERLCTVGGHRRGVKLFELAAE